MKRALVVDDKESNAYYLKVLLEGDGWVVEVARHGAEALTLARQNPPALVVSDLLMPVMDGYTLLRHWKADARLRPAPFVVYTATYTERDDEQLAIDLGADAFILKPSEPEVFLARVHKAMAQSALHDACRPAVHDAHNEDAHLRHYSATLIRKLEEKTLQLEETNRALERDIAERKRIEAMLRDQEALQMQLRQAQKMEAIGLLASGVAHDFNNMLSVILSYTALLQGQLNADSPAYRDVLEIQRAGERASDLTRQLLAFGRRRMLRPQVVDVGRIVAAMEPMMRRLIGEDIILSLSTPNVGGVLADPSQLEQVVMNLVVNARDAMPRGGTLRIETSNVDVDETATSHHDETPGGRYVRLIVSDTGTGMDAATREHIFEPFFTTKVAGKGTGLGLSTVFGIVQQSGGRITVRSEPGQGTAFEVYLPRTDQARVAPTLPPPPPASLRGTESILLVEDDEQVRSVITTILGRQGYNVVAAQNGGEALLIFEKESHRFHLLVTDVVMPHLSGPELAERLTAIRPGVPVLYLSGHAEGAIAHHGVLDAGATLVLKPITPDALCCKVREVLDAHPRRQ